MKNNKIAFDTESEAREELERILNTTFKPWKKEDRKPCRTYLDKDGKWYLTSSPRITEY